MRVLVVEDARRLADDIAEGLRDQAMAVDIAYDGVAAAAKLEINRYDVVVLDRDLPGYTATRSAGWSSRAASPRWCSCSRHRQRPGSA